MYEEGDSEYSKRGGQFVSEERQLVSDYLVISSDILDP